MKLTYMTVSWKFFRCTKINRCAVKNTFPLQMNKTLTDVLFKPWLTILSNYHSVTTINKNNISFLLLLFLSHLFSFLKVSRCVQTFSHWALQKQALQGLLRVKHGKGWPVLWIWDLILWRIHLWFGLQISATVGSNFLLEQ